MAKNKTTILANQNHRIITDIFLTSVLSSNLFSLQWVIRLLECLECELL
jgi:hypothetical protein